MAINNSLFCKDCDATIKDFIFTSAATFKKEMPRCAECGGKMAVDFRKHRGGVTTAMKIIGGEMYGKYHPGFGCIVRDYNHKQQLLKQYNVIESGDTDKGVRGGAFYPEGYEGPDHKPDQYEQPSTYEDLPTGSQWGEVDVQKQTETILNELHATGELERQRTEMARLERADSRSRRKRRNARAS